MADTAPAALLSRAALSTQSLAGFILMKTRFISLLLSAPFIGLSLPAHSASQDTDHTLSQLAIGGALLSWLHAYLSNDQALRYAIDLDPHQHRLGTSYGHFSADSHYTGLYYAKPSQQALISQDYFDLNAHWEVDLAYWQSRLTQPKSKDGYTFSVTPVLSYRLTRVALTPYLETGIGLAYISNSTMENIDKSTNFQFTEILGVGVQLADWRLGYRYRHISNAGISLPNNATDIHSVHLSYQF
ncbi:MAG: acyloxyacyl hydrolase [Thiomicrospira sp.]|jgi:lipid A 3-O-deacylase|nr:acyloxyacyl hydrolase [Thiomicrospira sp.]